MPTTTRHTPSASPCAPAPPEPAAAGAEPVAERQRGKRIKLIAITGGLYLGNVALLGLAFWVGKLPVHAVAVYTALVAAMLGLFAAYLSRIPDSKLGAADFTMIQMVSAAVPACYAVFQLGDAAARGAFLLTVVTPLLFGVMNLETRRFVAVASAYVLGYVAEMFALYAWAPQRADPGSDLLIGAAFVLVVFATALVGGYIFRLRGSLRRRTTELGEALARISDMAHRDALTGAPNRRALTEALGTLAERARATGAVFAAVLIDIDHFKRINDTHGHDAGDAVLRRVSACLREAIRAGDVMGRWGGEEFLMLMPDTPVDSAVALTERVRLAVAALDLSDVAPALAVTASFGVAQWQPHDATPEALVARADRSLYAAKSAGRNRVLAAANTPNTPNAPEPPARDAQHVQTGRLERSIAAPHAG